MEVGKYFQKIEKRPESDLAWNIPEQKRGTVNIAGGNSKNFRTEIKIAEFLAEKYPIENVRVVLPDTLRSELPPLENFVFLSSTDSGSFREADELREIFKTGDFNLILGDFSKNSITEKAVGSACENAEKPLLITRDAVDLITSSGAEKMLINEKVIFFASIVQLQKLLRAVYYPKILLMSQSLIQVVEVLHKFTLSYQMGIVTLHDGQILVAKNGEVRAIKLAESGYSAFMIWSGELAGKITVFNLYNPGKFLDATSEAVFV